MIHKVPNINIPLYIEKVFFLFLNPNWNALPKHFENREFCLLIWSGYLNLLVFKSCIFTVPYTCEMCSHYHMLMILSLIVCVLTLCTGWGTVLSMPHFNQLNTSKREIVVTRSNLNWTNIQTSRRSNITLELLRVPVTV